MIKIIDGDLLSSSAEIIAHQVNCQGKMGSGVAKQIREKYPEVFMHYKHICNLHTPESLLGHCQVVPIKNRKSIANLFGQLGYGYDEKQYTDLSALKRAMLKLRDRMDMNNEDCTLTVAFPYGLGSVRGGAKWEDVYKIIEEIFVCYNVEIWRWDRG